MPKQTVVALFADPDDAREGVSRLLDLGLAPEEIGLLEPRDVRRSKRPAKSAAVAVLGVLSGAATGGAVGTFAVGMAGFPATLVAAFVGILLGAYAGWILAGMFATDAAADDDRYFMREIQAGRVLVAAEVLDFEGENRAAAVLHASNALEVDSLGAARLQTRLRHPTEARVA